MSGKIVGLIFDHYPDCDPGELLTALVLADAADHDGGSVRPSVGRVAVLSRQAERTIQYHLREMEKRGVLVLVRKGGGRGRPAEYRIDTDFLYRQPGRALQRKGAIDAPISETVQKGCKKGAPEEEKGCKKGATVIAPDPRPVYPKPQQPRAREDERGGSGFEFDEHQLKVLISAGVVSGVGDEKRLQGVMSAVAEGVDVREAVDALCAALTSNSPPRAPLRWLSKVTGGGAFDPTPGLAWRAKLRAGEEGKRRYEQALGQSPIAQQGAAGQKPSRGGDGGEASAFRVGVVEAPPSAPACNRVQGRKEMEKVRAALSRPTSRAG